MIIKPVDSFPPPPQNSLNDDSSNEEVSLLEIKKLIRLKIEAKFSKLSKFFVSKNNDLFFIHRFVDIYIFSHPFLIHVSLIFLIERMIGNAFESDDLLVRSGWEEIWDLDIFLKVQSFIRFATAFVIRLEIVKILWWINHRDFVIRISKLNPVNDNTNIIYIHPDIFNLCTRHAYRIPYFGARLRNWEKLK